MTVEDNKMFPVNVADPETGALEEDQVQVFVKRTHPTGETLYEDADGNFYAATPDSPAHAVVKIDSEDDLPYPPNQDAEPVDNPAETAPPATGYAEPDPEPEAKPKASSKKG